MTATDGSKSEEIQHVSNLMETLQEDETRAVNDFHRWDGNDREASEKRERKRSLDTCK